MFPSLNTFTDTFYNLSSLQFGSVSSPLFVFFFFSLWNILLSLWLSLFQFLITCWPKYHALPIKTSGSLPNDLIFLLNLRNFYGLSNSHGSGLPSKSFGLSHYSLLIVTQCYCNTNISTVYTCSAWKQIFLSWDI